MRVKPILPLIFAVAGWLMPLLTTATAHEVTVYAYTTPAGKRMPSPGLERPARCLLVAGGRRELGHSRRGLVPAPHEGVDPLVRAALQVNHYPGVRKGEAPELVVAYHWGVANPELAGDRSGMDDILINEQQMLALVGGAALTGVELETERARIIAAAMEERYFLVVSAYDFATTAKSKKRLLLWRAQMSLPAAGHGEERALSFLAAAGGSLFGRDTTFPRRIEIAVSGELRAAPAAR
jgi:hypothetical protein